MNKKILIAIVTVVVIVALAVGGFFIALKNETEAQEITVEWANEFVNEKLDSFAKTTPTKLIAEKNSITVTDISYGDEKDIFLDCEITTIDVQGALAPQYDSFLATDVMKKTMFKSESDFKNEFSGKIVELLNDAEAVTHKAQLVLYDTKTEGIVLYATDEVINLVYGGVIDVKEEINRKESYIKVDSAGRETEVTLDKRNTNLQKGFTGCITPFYDDEKPDTSGALGKFINDVKDDFYQNFIMHNRWQTVLKGLWVTIQITFFALVIGVLLGFLVAFVRCAYIKNKKRGFLLSFFNAICQLYLTVIRGTPVVVQILIIHFVILQPMHISNFVSAFVCFGINSGAYVAEIVRGGIMSVDEGQTEAGRSLGFNYAQTMIYIIIPQAFKTVLPSLANEFVVLLKETSIAFYIGVADMMYQVVAIRSATYSAFMPLIASAIIYLILVLTFSKLVNILERRMRNSER